MDKTLSTPWLSLNRQSPDKNKSGEHISSDNPFAKSVAEPLFAANIEVAGMVCRKGYRSDRLHLAGCHYFLILLQGNLSVQHDDKMVHLKPGDIAYTTPTTNMRYKSEPNEITWWMYFKIYDTPNWNDLKKRGSFVESCDSGAHMFILMRQILDAHKSRNLKNMNAALGDSQILLRLLRQLINHRKEPSQRLNTLSNLVSDISKQPELKWNQAKMAGKLFISVRTLLRLFQSEYGCAPKEMVIQQRLNRAMQLLISTDFNIEEVAHQCGYDNVSSFSRTFHKEIGMTPGQYRRKSNTETDFDY
jgi:AraC family transcriptional regulator, arabinose operon regulatory protein